MPLSPTSSLFVAGLSLSVMITGCGGSSSNSTPVPPPTAPDFTLSISPSSVTVARGASGSASVTATGSGSFTGKVALIIAGLPSGVTASPASLSLSPGTPQSVAFASSSQASTGNFSVTLTGFSGTLTHTATLPLMVSAASSTAAAVDVTTYHYDNARDGLNSQESTLTLTNVNSKSFGLVATYPVDAKVDAEPLYLSNVVLSNSTTPNILYVATEHDTVYAFDTFSGNQIWKSSLIGSGETTGDPGGCDQITPEMGITSTPVIDRAFGTHGAIFVIGLTQDGSGKYHHRLHALDLTTGNELSGSPTEIAATYAGSGQNSSNGKITFDPARYAERVGLLLLNGTIYTAWTSHCDIQPYSGWVIGYDEASLKQSAVFNLTPNGSEGAIWMSGFGLAADSSNNIYFIDANGTLDDDFSSSNLPDKMDYGNAIVKLSTSGSLALEDYFEPFNTNAESAADTDFGSGGAMLLPDLVDASGKTRHLVVGAGKDTNIYIADRDNMGKFNGSAANNSNLYQELPGALAKGAFSGPAYFNNTIYYAGVGDTLKAFPISNALLAPNPSSKSSVTFPYPGSTPAVSANGGQNGIVWAVESSLRSPGVLHAFDSSNLANELYNSKQAGQRDAFGNGNKFITPLVVGGHVYVGTQNSVAVFGLLAP